jgi:YggT family protein
MGILVLTIDFILRALTFLIFARVILSWIRVSPYHPTWGSIIRFIYQTTDPIMEPVRRAIPPMGGLDWSPLIVLLGLSFLRNIIFQLLSGF